MSAHVSPHLLSRLSALIEAHMGLHFPEERWRDLERKIQAAAHELGMSDATACAEWLVSSPLTEEQVKLLADYLTVGETYFFRDQPMWEALRTYVLPRLLSSRSGTQRTLRFWSAASCTGEEPYSLAILLRQALPASQAHNATILATDINPSFLHKATEGVYGHWSFRGVSDALRDRSFQKTDDGRFAILPTLQEHVRFAELNIAEDVYPSMITSPHGMDVILCRNILFYFTPERAQRVIDHLYDSLADGGWLIVSPVEAAYVVESPFIPVQLPGGTFFYSNYPGSKRVV